MLVVAALGGNALLKRGEPLTAGVQRKNVQIAARSLAAVVRAGHDLVVTHGKWATGRAAGFTGCLLQTG